MSFFDSSFLWLDAVIAASITAAATAVVGVHALVRRVVFLPAALSQIAGLGVVAAFLLAHLAEPICDCHVSPTFFAIGFAVIGAMSLGLARERRTTTREWSLAAVYLLCSALILLIGGHIPQELHDVNNILFGNAIAIERRQMIFSVIIGVAVLAVQLQLARPLMAVAFDPVTARAHGVSVRGLDAILFASMGLAVAASTKVVGALPAFAFAVFPAAAALRLSHDARMVTGLAALFGAVSAFFGYWASFAWSLPTGACMAATALVEFLTIASIHQLVETADPTPRT